MGGQCMNFVTHITMADLIFKEVSALYELNRVAFVYGNIMPDVDPQFNKTPHMFDNSKFVEYKKTRHL